MSRPPARETPDKDVLSAKWRGFLSLLKGVLPALSAIAVGFYTILLYFDGHDKDNKARLLEAQKPFFDTQLKLYMETAKVAGQIVVIDRTKDRWLESKEWKEAYEKFYQLFWTELSVVEDKTVKTAMETFSAKLQEIILVPRDVEKDGELKQLSYQLARQIRSSIESSWQVQLGNVSETKKAQAPRPSASSSSR
jgi:hypothetical protein